MDKNSKKAFCKQCRSLDRFLCEISYYEKFRSLWFLVPKLMNIDEWELKVEYEFINWKNDYYSIGLNINNILHIIKNIQKVFWLTEDKNAIDKIVLDFWRTCSAPRFIKHIENIITQEMIDAIYNNPIVWIFKDSKPQNRIIMDSSIYMIDFDYVVLRAHFLSDIIQFLWYLFIDKIIDFKSLINYVTEYSIGLWIDIKYKDINLICIYLYVYWRMKMIDKNSENIKLERKIINSFKQIEVYLFSLNQNGINS